MRKTGFIENNVTRRKSRLFPVVCILLLIISLISVVSYYAYKHVNTILHSRPSIAMLKDKWAEYDYQSVYDISTELLEKDTFSNTVLTYRGYAAFYLAASATEPSESQSFINESIRCLRLALLSAKSVTKSQVEYMLGKAYFYKNTISSYHYYSDLAVKYLNEAVKDGYVSDDIPEYLGLSYASLGMTLESIQAFSEALLVRESDTLILSIAEQYYKAKQYKLAKQYLFQIISDSDEEGFVLKSRMLLGNINLIEESYEEAFSQFSAILEKNPKSADAHYGFGVIYEKQGDLIKARSEWRKALRIQSNHQDSLKKLSQYR